MPDLHCMPGCSANLGNLPEPDAEFAADGASVTGTTLPNVTVYLDITGDGQPDQNVVSGGDGTFSFPIAPPLVNGEVGAVWIEDANGNVSNRVEITAPTV